MARPALKVWHFALGDSRDDGVEFVAARSERGAAVLALRQLGCPSRRLGEFGVELTRCEAFDKYAVRTGVGDVTDEQRFDAGWPVFCWECEHRLDDDVPCDSCAQDHPDEDGDYDDFPVVSGERVFCAARCLINFQERHRRVAEKKRLATAALLARFPFVTPLGAWVGSTGECCGGEGAQKDAMPPNRARKGKTRPPTCYDVDHENVVVRFKVPGGGLSETVVDGNAFHNVYCSGCRQAWIARGDYAAFECASVRPDAVVG